MKYLFSILLICLAATAWGQKIQVQARDGKAVIVQRDTTATGEVQETSSWVANPRKVLQESLDKTEKRLSAIPQQITRLQAEQKALKQQQRELKKAIADLDAGILIETGIPGAKAAPAPEQTPTPPPAKNKTTKKAKKQ